MAGPLDGWSSASSCGTTASPTNAQWRSSCGHRSVCCLGCVTCKSLSTIYNASQRLLPWMRKMQRSWVLPWLRAHLPSTAHLGPDRVSTIRPRCQPWPQCQYYLQSGYNLATTMSAGRNASMATPWPQPWSTRHEDACTHALMRTHGTSWPQPWTIANQTCSCFCCLFGFCLLLPTQ